LIRPTFNSLYIAITGCQTSGHDGNHSRNAIALQCKNHVTAPHPPLLHLSAPAWNYKGKSLTNGEGNQFRSNAPCQINDRSSRRGIEWWGRNDACEVTGRDGHAAISGTTRRRDDNNLISSSALHLQLHLTNQTLLNSLEAKYGSTTQAVSRTKRGSSKKLHDHPQAKITSMRHSTSHNSSIHDIGDMHN